MPCTTMSWREGETGEARGNAWKTVCVDYRGRWGCRWTVLIEVEFFCLHVIISLSHLLALFFHDSRVASPPAAFIAPKERVHWWVERYILAEVPGSIAQGRPADNYKPFNKHCSAAPDGKPIGKQSSNETATTKHGVHESDNISYWIGKHGSKLQRQQRDTWLTEEKEKTTAELRIWSIL